MKGIEENKHNILHNEYRIKQNRQAINEIKEGCSRCVPQNVFREIIEWYSGLTKRLIWIVCVVAFLLFVSNMIWIVVWSTRDVPHKETTIITNDGKTNMIGNDGNITEDGE